MDLKNFLRPDKKRALLFAAFLGLMYLADVQAWAFTDDPATKPWLFEYIKDFPAWIGLVMISLPITILTVPLSQAGLMSSGLMIAINAAYFYLLSCAMAAAYEKTAAKIASGHWAKLLLPK